MENKYKPVYKLRKEDFIPIVGIKTHMGRCLEEVGKSWSERSSEEDTELEAECWARDCVLTLYNATIIAGAGVAISGLVQLLSK
jgi:hypothetical protein